MSEIVYVGMDLGTSRTSITTSTGVRTTVWSYVGYAHDHVSKKLLGGRDKVFGEEAVQNRMAVDLVRPFDKGVIVEDDNAEIAPPYCGNFQEKVAMSGRREMSDNSMNILRKKLTTAMFLWSVLL